MKNEHNIVLRTGNLLTTIERHVDVIIVNSAFGFLLSWSVKPSHTVTQSNYVGNIIIDELFIG